MIMKTSEQQSKPVRQVKHPKPIQQEYSQNQKEMIQSIPALQQLIGNQALQRLIDPQVEELGLDHRVPVTAAPVQDFNRLRLQPDAGSSLHKIQSRSTIVQTATQQTEQPGSMQLHTEVMRYPFQVAIRRGSSSAFAGRRQAIPQRSDAAPDEESDDSRLESLFDSYDETPSEVTEGPTETQSGAGPNAGAPAEAAQTPPAPAGASPEGGETAQTEGGSTTPPASAAPTAGGTTAPPSTEGPTAGGTTVAPSSGVPEAGGTSGPPVRLPDIEIPQLAQANRTDSILSAFAYSVSIARGGAGPTGFGVTRSFGCKLTNLTITPAPSIFVVTGTFLHPITYQIRTATGPDGQVDISSAADSKITNANYAAVATDLTPNMGDLNGRPPRNHYWAEDLTSRHELVHANDDKNNGPAAMWTALGWLMRQTAANEDFVRLLLESVPARFANALLAALSTEDGEIHAYGDGAPRYQARAELIKGFGRDGIYS